MCNITNVKSRKKTGYKVVAYKDGKYYSTFTGQELKVGKVPKAPKRCEPLTYNWSICTREDTTIHLWYNPNFDGMTSAFTNKNDALRLCAKLKCHKFHKFSVCEEFDIIIVNIKFDGNVFKGYYNLQQVIAGSDIKSIKQVKTKPYIIEELNKIGGSRFSTSVGGTLIGFHGDILIVDDPL